MSYKLFLFFPLLFGRYVAAFDFQRENASKVNNHPDSFSVDGSLAEKIQHAIFQLKTEIKDLESKVISFYFLLLLNNTYLHPFSNTEFCTNPKTIQKHKNCLMKLKYGGIRYLGIENGISRISFGRRRRYQ